MINKALGRAAEIARLNDHLRRTFDGASGIPYEAIRDGRFRIHFRRAVPRAG